MKRANDTPAFPGHASTFTNVGPELRTSQQPTPSTVSTTSAASTEINTDIRPGMTSTTNRTGTSILPAALLRWQPQMGYPIAPNYQLQPQPLTIASGVYRTPVINQVRDVHFFYGYKPLSPPPAAQPAAAPDKLAGDHGDRDIFKNTTLDLQVKSEISGFSQRWMITAHSLKGQEKIDFLIASLVEIAMKHGSNGNWNGAINHIMDMVGMDAMLAQKWPGNNSLAYFLARVKDHKWLALALAREGALQSLHSSDERGLSPLHVAAMNGKKKMVEAILAHDDEAGSLRLKKAKDTSIPLHVACQCNHGSIVALLLGSKGKEQRLSASDLGVLPIHTALASGNGGLQHLLAECAKEQVAAQVEDGRNALMLAAQIGLQNSVKMLLNVPGALAVQLGARDRKGRGAIDHARDGGNAEIIALIEAAVKNLPATSSEITTSTATTVAISTSAHQGPVPLTPYPTDPAAENDVSFSDTEIESVQQ